jgi:hypothetical protein
MVDKIVAFKGFDKYLKCRDYQYKIGEEFTHNGEVKACESGFHSCEYPLDVFNYYPPSDSVFALVDVYGEISKESNGDSKISSSKLHIKAEMKIPDLVGYAVNYIINKLDKKSASTNTGNRSVSTNTGNYSASTNTGYYSASTNTGNRSASTNSGDYSASTNTGDYSASTNTGYYSASTNTGNRSVSTNTGYYSASTNTGNYSASTNTGNYSASTNTGNRSASTNTGNYSASTNTGKNGVALNIGVGGEARASIGSAIVLCYHDSNNNHKLTHIKSAIIDGIILKENTFYILNANNEFEEVS